MRRKGMQIGCGCDILSSRFSFGSEPWLIQIGNDVTIASDVKLITHDGSSRLFRNKFPEMSRFGNRFAPIIVEDNVFIGMNALILPGVRIGTNSIVGAGSVVTKDVEANTVVAGNPARKICSMEEYIERFRSKMIPLSATSRSELRAELVSKLMRCSPN